MCKPTERTDLRPHPNYHCGLWKCETIHPQKLQLKAFSNDVCAPKAISILSVVPAFRNGYCKNSCWWRDVRGCGSAGNFAETRWLFELKQTNKQQRMEMQVLFGGKVALLYPRLGMSWVRHSDAFQLATGHQPPSGTQMLLPDSIKKRLEL